MITPHNYTFIHQHKITQHNRSQRIRDQPNSQIHYYMKCMTLHYTVNDHFGPTGENVVWKMKILILVPICKKYDNFILSFRDKYNFQTLNCYQNKIFATLRKMILTSTKHMHKNYYQQQARHSLLHSWRRNNQWWDPPQLPKIPLHWRTWPPTSTSTRSPS